VSPLFFASHSIICNNFSNLSYEAESIQESAFSRTSFNNISQYAVPVQAKAINHTCSSMLLSHLKNGINKKSQTFSTCS